MVVQYHNAALTYAYWEQNEATNETNIHSGSEVRIHQDYGQTRNKGQISGVALQATVTLGSYERTTANRILPHAGWNRRDRVHQSAFRSRQL